MAGLTTFAFGMRITTAGAGVVAAITLDVYAELFDTDFDAVEQAFDEEYAQNGSKTGLKAVE
jgi:hypothetical protein